MKNKSVYSTRFVKKKDLIRLAVQAKDDDDRSISAALARSMIRAWKEGDEVKLGGVTYFLNDGAREVLATIKGV